MTCMTAHAVLRYFLVPNDSAETLHALEHNVGSMTNIEKAIALLRENIATVPAHGCKRDEVLALLTEEPIDTVDLRSLKVDEPVCDGKDNHSLHTVACKRRITKAQPRDFWLVCLTHKGKFKKTKPIMGSDLPKENHDNGC